MATSHPERLAAGPPPPGDDDTLDALVETSFAIQELLGRIADDHDLSLTQLRLLGILRDREPAMLELARHLHLEKSSASGLIDRAEQRGLVARRASSEDRRSVHVAITPAGRAIGEKARAAIMEPFAAVIAPLSARQRARLTALLRTLLDGEAVSRLP
jgi:DNA-binding MarR family transcriptional regulator